ncbi:MAG: LysM peptidoglycan-binding domain-containing protein [Rhodobacteraceae bacterium]|nr:LysM peptidoglycan-binding domain-containing protein [Paracoccaceae bacterium]
MFRYLIAPFVIAVLMGVGAVALFTQMAMEAPESPTQPRVAAQDAPAAIETTPEINSTSGTEQAGEIATASIETDSRAADSSETAPTPAPAAVAALQETVDQEAVGASVAGAAGQTRGADVALGTGSESDDSRPTQAFANVAPSAPSSLSPSLPNVTAPAESPPLFAPPSPGLAAATSSGAVSSSETSSNALASQPASSAPAATAPGLPTPPRLGLGGASTEAASGPAGPGAALPPLASAETALAIAGNLAPALESPLGGAANPELRDETPDLRPVFDLVRVEPGGAAVLAGRASPNSMVSVTVDGDVVAEVRANRSGEFVALVETAPDAETRGLTLGLSSTTVDGMTLSSAAPVVVALPDEPGAPPVALRPTEQGPELLQPTAPRADGGVSIDSVSYGDAGAVVVSGRGSPGQVARVYLDENLHAEAEVASDGEWRADLDQEIKPEVYKLRVDQINAQGGVSSRAETPFERAPVEDIVLNRSGVVVQPGNNLWRIASHVYGDGLKYHVIYARNNDQIRDPDLIYPGQIFKLPGAE